MITLTFLGGAREVGRSCIHLQTKNLSLVLDCGLNLGATDENHVPLSPPAPPKYAFITHAHLDHSGYVPLLVKKYKTTVVATPPTQDISELLQSDYVKIARENEKEMLYEHKDILAIRKYTKDAHYRVPYTFSSGLTTSFYAAGHILGSSMIYLKSDKHRILYTGDMMMTNTRTIQMADTNLPPFDTLIIESTYSGVNDRHPAREKIEREFIETIKDTYTAGGKILVPVFAVGRAQEVMLTLEAYIKSKALPKMPIFIDGLIKKVNKKYRLFWEWLRPEVQRQIRYTYHSPLDSKLFVEVSSRKKLFSKDEPIIILSPSGMLQGGPVLYYLKRIANSSRNLITLTGYQVPGTRGRALLDGNKEIDLGDEKVNINAKIKNFDFSAHTDYGGLIRFISLFKSIKNIILVHGEQNKILSFKHQLESKYKDISIYAPASGEEIILS